MKAYMEICDSPAGPVLFAVNEAGALIGLEFQEGTYERPLEEELARDGYQLSRDAARTAPARRQLEEYTAGQRQSFDLPLAFSGTGWQVTVWQALLSIPFGERRTYGQIAAQVGRPTAARAVGSANASNHLPLVVPCHRVVGASGALTGFAGGMHLKERLLAHEAAVLIPEPLRVTS